MALTPQTPSNLPLHPTVPNLPKGSDQVLEWITAFDLSYVASYLTLATRVQTYVTNAGQTTITGAATSAAVTFAGPEIDTSYYVLATVSNTTDATPLAGSTRFYLTNKATTGFTINLEAAPGGTDVVTLDWVVMR